MQKKNNILYPLQHGFRKGRSCETQLIEFVDDISKNLQEGRQTDILIMDFAKAFDKVNHSLLIHILRYYGIDGKTTRWIQNLLEDRQQTVVLDGVSSEAVSVDSGVPQGSVLGPGLILFYINDLQSRLTIKSESLLMIPSYTSLSQMKMMHQHFKKTSISSANGKMNGV